MNGRRRPWLTELVAFETPEGGSGGGTGGSGGGSGESGSGGPRTLEEAIRQYPHLATELDSRTSALATREKQHGLRSGVQEWVKGLGVEDPNVVAEGFRAYQQQQAAALTEAQRAEKAAAEKEAAAQKLLEDAKKAKFEGLAIKWLQDAKATDAAVASLSLAAEGVTVDSTEDEIKEAVKRLKARVPGLFTGEANGTPSGGNPGTPPGSGPGKNDPGKGEVGSQAKSQLERLVGKKRTPVGG